MPTLYYLGNTTDTALGTGADFSYGLLTATTTAVSQNMAIAGLATESSYGASPVGNPGTAGVNGTWTVLVRVTTAQSTQNVAVAIDRFNSSNVQQTTGTLTAAQTISAIGTYTFSPVVAAGTWSAGDRFRVRYAFASTNMTGVTSVIELRTALTQITMPDPPPSVSPEVYYALDTNLYY